MKNPWEKMALEHYEAHMGLQGVEQLQMLDAITQRQLGAFDVKSLAILGIAGGNGLSHIDDAITRIIGIDVNQDYLTVCRERYGTMNDRLTLLCADLSVVDTVIPQVELILANLFVEYVGVARFAELVQACDAKYVSCAIQVNTQAQFVSRSPYAAYFDKIGELHQNIDPAQLEEVMHNVSYVKLREEKHDLPNGKYLLRQDFENKSVGNITA